MNERIHDVVNFWTVSSSLAYLERYTVIKKNKLRVQITEFDPKLSNLAQIYFFH